MTQALLVLLCLFASFPTLAQTRTTKLKPLLFQADKNKVQVLPQRFEYTLLDEDRLKIGDILIDTRQITFQIEPSPQNKDLYLIHFAWPADLIKDGELALKNNSGKAIFTTMLTNSNLQLKPSPRTQEDEGLRSEVATLSTEISADVLESMKYLPFMEFCIFRESDETRIYLCSKELYLSSQGGLMTVKARSTNRKSSQIEINGKIVGNQGLIYLNDRSESVAFKAQMRTGAFLEIETRMKNVDFKDVVVSNDNENLILTASGARPVDETKVKKVSEDEWQIALPRTRPVLYLRGDGDIPMRQEFFVRGQLPRERNRAFLSPRSLSRTYSSKLTFTGIAPGDIEVKTAMTEATAKIESLKKDQFLWTLENIPKGKESRHYLELITKDNQFFAGYDVFRGEPFALGLNLQYLTPAGIAYGTIDFQWWFENFLSLNTSWTTFRWGLSIERQQQLIEKADAVKAHLTTLELLWRAEAGFNLIDATWGLSLPLQNIEGESASTMTYGLGAYLTKRPGRWLKPFMDWSEVKFQYFAGSTGSDINVSATSRASATALWSLSPQWHLRYGLDATAAEDTQWGVHAGAYWKF